MFNNYLQEDASGQAFISLGNSIMLLENPRFEYL
jgi:hypothetical protein